MAILFPNISPDLISISVGGVELALRWYALAYIGGLVAGWKLIMALMARPALWGGVAPMAPDRVEDLLSWVVFGVILGGRFGFVLFYQPEYFAANPLAVIRVWEGGMSFHGGLIGVIVAALLYAWRHKIAPRALGDAFALVAPIGLCLGRIANFINAELWGLPTAQPWGVIFPGDAAQSCGGFAGQVDGICARHPSQLYEAGLEGLGLGLLLLILFWRGALLYRGLLMGVFLAGYGCARFFVEYYRLADAQFITAENPLGWVVGGATWGLTMGQLLCLPMIAVGLYFVLRARRIALPA